MLKSMGERTPPCGNPDLNCRFVDVYSPFRNLYVIQGPSNPFGKVESELRYGFNYIRIYFNNLSRYEHAFYCLRTFPVLIVHRSTLNNFTHNTMWFIEINFTVHCR